jgi:hypothetical protein
VGDELGKMLTIGVMPYFEILPQNLPGGTAGNRIEGIRSSDAKQNPEFPEKK